MPPNVPSFPPPSPSHKPVTPLRHRTGVTFSFRAVLCILPSLLALFFTACVELNKHAASQVKKVEEWCHEFCQLTFSCLALKTVSSEQFHFGAEVRGFILQSAFFRGEEVCGLRPSLPHIYLPQQPGHTCSFTTSS